MYLSVSPIPILDQSAYYRFAFNATIIALFRLLLPSYTTTRSLTRRLIIRLSKTLTRYSRTNVGEFR